jgi:hypothetical protein
MENKWLTVLLIAVFIKSVVWLAQTPVFQAPDENIHYAMIHYLGENNRHPGKRNSNVNSLEFLEAIKIVNFSWRAQHPVWRGLSQNWWEQLANLDPKLRQIFIYQLGTDAGQKLPQAYYWLNYPVYKLIQGADFLVRFYALRLVSVILGLVTVYLTYLTAKLVLNHQALALATAVLVGFQPMASVIFSSITYDSLAILLSTWFIYLMVQFFKSHQLRYQFQALAIAGLGLMTKTQLIALVLVWPLGLLKKQRRWWPVLLLGLFFLSKLKEFSEIIRQGWTWLTTTPALALAGNYWEINAPALWAQTFPWYWGVFGWLEKTMPLWVYASLKIIMLISLVGCLKAYKFWSKTLTFLLVISLVLVLVVMLNDFLIFTRNGSGFGVQGRYFLPAIAGQMILLVYGLKSWLQKKYWPALSRLIVIGSLALNAIGIYTLNQFFGWIW